MLQAFGEIEEPFDPDSLARFGRMIKELVSTHSDFWLLMYIDVLEFENRHFRKMFEGLAAKIGGFGRVRNVDQVSVRQCLLAGANPAPPRPRRTAAPSWPRSGSARRSGG